MILRKSLHVSHLDVSALYLRQYQLYYLQAGETHMVFHIPRPGVPRLEVHDSHLVDLGPKWYRDVHTQLPRRLDGHILQDDVGEVVPLPWHPIPGIEGRHKVPRMAGEREETAGAAGVPLGVVQYPPFSVSAYVAAGPEKEENVPQNGLYRSISGRVLGLGPRDIHGYWTWKPACAADVRSMLMLSANREVIAVRSEGMVDRGQVQHSTESEGMVCQRSSAARFKDRAQDEVCPDGPTPFGRFLPVPYYRKEP